MNQPKRNYDIVCMSSSILIIRLWDQIKKVLGFMNFIIFNLKKMKNSLLHYTNIFVEGTPNLAFDNFFFLQRSSNGTRYS